MSRGPLDALWSVTFASNVRQPGIEHAIGGVVVLDSGRLLGGDRQFFYVGTVRERNGSVEAEINVDNYRPEFTGQSVFGKVDKFKVQLKGPSDPNKMFLKGTMVGSPDLELFVELVRRAELR
jgi:hypothetical protein